MEYEFFTKYAPPPAPEPLPEQAVRIEWLGTASFRFIYKGSILLIDPFVTRPRITRVGTLRLPCNKTLCAEVFPRADDILISHSHFDHLLDAPFIARTTGAVIHGSRSTEAVCRGAGLVAMQMHTVETWKRYDIGRYQVTFAPSIHGKALMGRIPIPGEITGEPKQPMRASEYRHGDVYALLIEAGGFRALHLGSADFIDEEMERVGPIDLLIVGLSGRQETPNYLARLNKFLQPKYIVPHHYDDFFKPLEMGFRLIRGVDIESFFREYEESCPGVKLLMPELFMHFAFDTQTHEAI